MYAPHIPSEVRMSMTDAGTIYGNGIDEDWGDFEVKGQAMPPNQYGD